MPSAAATPRWRQGCHPPPPRSRGWCPAASESWQAGAGCSGGWVSGAAGGDGGTLGGARLPSSPPPPGCHTHSRTASWSC